MGCAIRHNYKLNFAAYAHSFRYWQKAILALLLQYDVNEKFGEPNVLVWRDWNNGLAPKGILKSVGTKAM